MEIRRKSFLHLQGSWHERAVSVFGCLVPLGVSVQSYLVALNALNIPGGSSLRHTLLQSLQSIVRSPLSPPKPSVWPKQLHRPVLPQISRCSPDPHQSPSCFCMFLTLLRATPCPLRLLPSSTRLHFTSLPFPRLFSRVRRCQNLLKPANP